MNVNLFTVRHVLEGFVERKESGIRNAEFAIFQILTCYSITFLFVENHFAFTIFFHLLLLIVGY